MIATQYHIENRPHPADESLENFRQRNGRYLVRILVPDLFQPWALYEMREPPPAANIPGQLPNKMMNWCLNWQHLVVHRTDIRGVKETVAHQ